LNIFRPGDQREAREQLGLPADARVLLFAASGIRQNAFKDFQTLRDAVAKVAARHPSGAAPLLLIALGESAPPEQIGAAQVRFVPFESNPAAVAQYYRAADLYLHAARADTFPTTVLEALACGTPVVATAVGGIPEQVCSLLPATSAEGEPCTTHSEQSATGVLVRPRAPQELGEAIELLLSKPQLRSAMSANAARDAAARFCAEKNCDAYVAWFAQIRQQWNSRSTELQPPQALASARRSNEMSYTA
jgi:glycosyltransferase involved in cell wall biosynthesis